MTIRWTYCVLNFVWFRQPCPETDLGDGCTGIESEYFSKRHAEDKMRKNILRFHSLIHLRGPDTRSAREVMDGRR